VLFDGAPFCWKEGREFVRSVGPNGGAFQSSQRGKGKHWRRVKWGVQKGGKGGATAHQRPPIFLSLDGKGKKEKKNKSLAEWPALLAAGEGKKERVSPTAAWSRRQNDSRPGESRWCAQKRKEGEGCDMSASKTGNHRGEEGRDGCARREKGNTVA